MNSTVKRLLRGEWDNHMLPFFWQHGEDEHTLRDYMRAIHDSGCGAVCVESRPHPDFCGPRWWADLDVILDEARTRGMKVWILDDSHFPTGYANGAVEKAPEALCRQSICASPVRPGRPAQTVTLEPAGMIPSPFEPTFIEQHVLAGKPPPRHFEDDTLLCVTAFCAETGERADLGPLIREGVLSWPKPEGDWTVWVVGLSRNCGPHRNYINMLKGPSVKLLLDAVYEPHYARYAADFGETIAGFFSDEPELGNGHLYDHETVLGRDIDYPFSDELAAELESRLGPGWAGQMFLLWENNAPDAEKARVRFQYMDAVTRLVERDFSFLLGDWCRAHGVQYIGHVLEDDGLHARTGSGVGHFFRGLAGQDMAGIDDIGGQVYPQGEDDAKPNHLGQRRDGEFYHFLLGRLASSAAAIDPLKKGRAMCEIFGNYGWAEGVRLEKYLADHFMVRGVNHYVPHAFSPKPFPDPDCPPHFYAHGHNPQYRHFGALMRYMNRACTLISSGARAAEAALLYHAEAEWTGRCMPGQRPARVLEESQISFDVIPCDVFSEVERYKTELGNPLRVNTRCYKALVVPTAQFVTAAFAAAAARLHRAGLPVVFIDALPEGVCDGDDALLAGLAGCPVATLETLAALLAQAGVGQVQSAPPSAGLRVLHTRGDTDVFMLVNEAAEPYAGAVTLPAAGPCFAYNAWDNRLDAARVEAAQDGAIRLQVEIEPLKSLFIVFGNADGTTPRPALREGGEEIPLSGWMRALCEGAAYPAFGPARPVALPDDLAGEQPEFSGFARYETTFAAEETAGLCLLVTDAAEGVEAFVNGQSAGLQIAPPLRFDISALAKPGENTLAIEVATTLERQCYPLLEGYRKMMAPVPSGPSGLCGTVRLYRQRDTVPARQT